MLLKSSLFYNLNNACIEGPFVFRRPEKRKSRIDFRFSILKNNLENKISIYFKFIKGPTVFRARDKRKTDFETNFVLEFFVTKRKHCRRFSGCLRNNIF